MATISRNFTLSLPDWLSSRLKSYTKPLMSLAQNHLQQWDLGQHDQPARQLVVNWRPCIMCFGATIWSGVNSLVIAGSGPELEEITGFDEGPVPADWQTQLERRGIKVTDNILTDEAIEVFREFRDSGKLVYNSRSKSM